MVELRTFDTEKNEKQIDNFLAIDVSSCYIHSFSPYVPIISNIWDTIYYELIDDGLFLPICNDENQSRLDHIWQQDDGDAHIL